MKKNIPYCPLSPQQKYKLLKLQGLEDDVLFVGGSPQPSAKKSHVDFDLARPSFGKKTPKTTEDVAFATEHRFVAWMCLKLFCCFELVCLSFYIGAKKALVHSGYT